MPRQRIRMKPGISQATQEVEKERTASENTGKEMKLREVSDQGKCGAGWTRCSGTSLKGDPLLIMFTVIACSVECYC